VLFGGTLKLAAHAEAEDPNDVADTASASRLARLKNSNFTDTPPVIPDWNSAPSHARPDIWMQFATAL